MEPNKNKIPKIIHFIWYGSEQPWYIKYYIHTVKKRYPKFKFRIWGEKDFDPKSTTYTRRALEEKKWAFISDYLRAKIMFDEGGIYLDTDMVPIGSMLPLLDLGHNVILGWEYDKLVSTGFVAAVPGQILFEKIIETYDSFDDVEKPFKFLINNELWTLILNQTYNLTMNGKEQLLAGGIKIYPQTFFSEGKINDESIFLHDHKLSWTSPRKARIMKPALQLIRNIQGFIGPVLSLATQVQFYKNRKALKRTKQSKMIEKD